MAVLPILFLGGMGASQLTADLNKTTAPHWFCETNQKGYPLWLDFVDFAPGAVDCWLDNVYVRWKWDGDSSGSDGDVSSGARWTGAQKGATKSHPKVVPGGGGVTVSPTGQWDMSPDPNAGFSKSMFTELMTAAADASDGYYDVAGSLEGTFDGDSGLKEEQKNTSATPALSSVASSVASPQFKRFSVGTLHYDWRLGPNEWAEDGTFLAIKQKIERFVRENDGRPAIIVTLSEGGTFLHEFLTSFMTRGDVNNVDSAGESGSANEWKARNVYRWFALSTPFGGAAELSRMLFYPDGIDYFHLPDLLPYIDRSKLRAASLTFPGVFITQPVYLGDEEVLVSVGDNGRSRSFTRSQLHLALTAANHTDAAAFLMAQEPILDDRKKLEPPGVAMDCVFGSQNPIGTANTTVGGGIEFPDGFDRPSTGYRAEYGDTVIPARSLERCRDWVNPTQKQKQGTGGVRIFPVEGASHGGTLRDPRVLQAFAEMVKEGNEIYRNDVSAEMPSQGPEPNSEVKTELHV